jgi:hypothetical protein
VKLQIAMRRKYYVEKAPAKQQKLATIPQPPSAGQARTWQTSHGRKRLLSLGYEPRLFLCKASDAGISNFRRTRNRTPAQKHAPGKNTLIRVLLTLTKS